MKPDLSTPLRRLKAYAWAMSIEHNAVNLLRPNLHLIGGQAYRSSQPTPGQILSRARALELKSIVCLRGFPEDSPLKALEEEACERAGVKLHTFKLWSRDVPRRETVLEAKELLESLAYPALFHCKSGADRVGLLSTFYQHFILGVPIESCDQLRFWPFGHIKGAQTGMLDHFFATYVAYAKEHPITFLEWVEQVMDREAIKKSFTPDPVAKFLVNSVLNRE